jgi:AraC-like DNA-binding protein
MQRAAKLLATTDLPVKAVAGRVGYRSRSHFSRAFKARYGVDPAGFRTGAADPATAAVPRGPGQPPPAADQGGPASPVAFWGPQERRSG